MNDGLGKRVRDPDYRQSRSDGMPLPQREPFPAPFPARALPDVSYRYQKQSDYLPGNPTRGTQTMDSQADDRGQSLYIQPYHSSQNRDREPGCLPAYSNHSTQDNNTLEISKDIRAELHRKREGNSEKFAGMARLSSGRDTANLALSGRSTPATTSRSRKTGDGITCTIYAKPFPVEVTDRDVLKVFNQFGRINKLRFRQILHNEEFKEAVYIEFQTLEASQAAVANPPRIGPGEDRLMVMTLTQAYTGVGNGKSNQRGPSAALSDSAYSDGGSEVGSIQDMYTDTHTSTILSDGDVSARPTSEKNSKRGPRETSCCSKAMDPLGVKDECIIA